ncbi:hypothetical protein [Streptomyces sp. NPDC001100]
MAGLLLFAGRGQRVTPLDLTTPMDIAVADYDHDLHPDLATYTYEGDGVYDGFEVLLGEGTKGLGGNTHRYTAEAGASGYDPPGRLPHSGLTPFYPSCARVGSNG